MRLHQLNNKGKFDARVKALNTVGNAGVVGQTMLSKKDKLNDPRRQRKERRWERED